MAPSISGSCNSEKMTFFALHLRKANGRWLRDQNTKQCSTLKVTDNKDNTLTLSHVQCLESAAASGTPPSRGMAGTTKTSAISLRLVLGRVGRRPPRHSTHPQWHSRSVSLRPEQQRLQLYLSAGNTTLLLRSTEQDALRGKHVDRLGQCPVQAQWASRPGPRSTACAVLATMGGMWRPFGQASSGLSVCCAGSDQCSPFSIH